ncbi:shikimate dehydrogenase family protein [Subtercola lobariae]|uniref:shikimate dehydrogenase (NADP(+)) n=1 Tax=Subtercola lobariae TaxID=1588641 RepID=A0A917EX81_9MICO|nr:shikimate dehydrogenase [Subtercola lobariae]GGF18337.1 shikimate 5-dehydrogenase [Subtercola lobariae]
MTITGNTSIYAHIGFPIHHTRAAALFNGLFEDLGIDVAVVPFEIEPDQLSATIPAFRAWRNLVGVGVTIPHKETMLSLVDELTPMAKLCGATNVIRRDPDGRLIGGQCDGTGLVRSLTGAGHQVSGAKVLLSGAGGTARPVAFALADAGVGRLEIANRTREKAEGIVAEIRAAYPDRDVRVHEDADEFDIVVNTTSLGMNSDDPLPVEAKVLRPGVVVADAVMAPPETALLKLAASRGAIPHPGILMLRSQFEVILDFLGLTSK